jgi:hypothetical protein
MPWHSTWALLTCWRARDCELAEVTTAPHPIARDKLSFVEVSVLEI